MSYSIGKKPVATNIDAFCHDKSSPMFLRPGGDTSLRKVNFKRFNLLHLLDEGYYTKLNQPFLSPMLVLLSHFEPLV